MDLSFEHAVITHAAHYAYDTVNPLGKVEADKAVTPLDQQSWAPTFDSVHDAILDFRFG
eukprot:COSAG06_NODE_801_length_12195_cov_106.299934_3_plen_59_part_00